MDRNKENKIEPEQAEETKQQSELLVDYSRELGSGSHATVYRASFGPGFFAVKVGKDGVDPKFMKKEGKVGEALAKLDSEYLIGIHHFELIPKPFLVMDYAAGGDLLDFVASNHPDSSSWQHLSHIAYEIAMGIHALHSMRIIHCDIKPENIVFDAPGGVGAKLTDYGIAINEGEKDVVIGGSAMYCAPEAWKNSPVFTNKLDIYSFAITLYVMTHKLSPYTSQDPQVLAKAVTEGLRPVIATGTVPVGFQTAMLLGWQENSPSRPSAECMASHFQAMETELTQKNQTTPNV